MSAVQTVDPLLADKICS